MSIGARLKEARKRMKLKQEDFAGRCGIVLKTQSRFERDEFVPSGEYLLALEALDIDASYVLTGRPSARNDEETALLDAFRQLDVQQQNQFMAHLIERAAITKFKDSQMDYDFQAFSELVKQASHPYRCEVAFKHDDGEKTVASSKPRKPAYTLEIQLFNESGAGILGVSESGFSEDYFSEKKARSLIHNLRKELRQRGHALTPWRFPSQ